MFCGKCGSKIENGMDFCTKCGAAVLNEQTKTAQQSSLQPFEPQQNKLQKKKSPLIPILVGILAVLVVLLAGAFVFKEDIVDLFEKETTTESEIKEKNATLNSGKENDEFLGFRDEQTAVAQETTFKQAELEEELKEVLKNTKPVVTRVEEQIVTEVATNTEGRYEVVTAAVANNSKGLTSTDAAAIADYYNKAVYNTGSINASQTLVLSKPINGDGAIGTILKVMQPVVDKTLANNSKAVYTVPGSYGGKLLSSDIEKATAISKDGKTTVTIMLKSQTDGPDDDKNNAGPVSRGIGTLGNIDNALTELGMTMESGRDTVKLTYSNAYIKCVIDEDSGDIISGTWFYTTDILIGSSQVHLAGIHANLNNLTAAVDYKVVY